MVQTKSLNFVLPIVWDDPYENRYLELLIETLDSTAKNIAAIYENICFAQSWSYLDESDVMWRIYSYDNQLSWMYNINARCKFPHIMLM